MIRKVLDVIEKAQRYATGAFFFLTLLVVSFQVTNRMVLKWPVTWTIDASVFCFVWLSLLAASSSVRRNGHFRVTAIVDLQRFSGRPRQLLETLAIVGIIVLSLVLFAIGARFAMLGWNEQSPGLAYPMFWAYVAVPFCSGTALLFGLEKLWQLWLDPEGYAAATIEEV